MMLTSLHIENIAVIKSVDIDLAGGFSSFTGETGAGKSIIIDSIGLLLGKRAERELIRTGESRALVSAVFDDLAEETLAALSSCGVEPDEEGKLLIQRTVQTDGHSSVRINGRAITLSVLKEIGPALIHIHGQNDNRLITDPQNQTHILDSYADDGQLLEEYRSLYHELCALRRQIRDVSVDEGQRLREIEMLRYQIADIDAVSLRAGEEEKLEEKRGRLKNAEKISKNVSFAYRALKGSEKGSVVYILSRAIQALSQLADVIPEVQSIAADLEEKMWQIDDSAEKIDEFGGDIEGDPTELLNRVEARLDAIDRLCRKYGKGGIADVLDFRAKAAERLSDLESADDCLVALQKEEEACYARVLAQARKLHEARVTAASQLEAEIAEALAFLDMPRVHFKISIQEQIKHGRADFDENGFDKIEFLISTNPGEPPAPMAKIASGGELSRIMLSIKSVLADKDGIPTIIYDEVDTGVSGKTARKIGIKLRDAGSRSQVLCVTHSAQIASLADCHFVIAKGERDGRAETSVLRLTREERVEELARILGGLSVTDAQRLAAIDMLQGQ